MICVFCVLFNSISVISGRWKCEYERLFAVKHRLGSEKKNLAKSGVEPETPWSEVGSDNRLAMRSFGILEALRVKIYVILLLSKSTMYMTCSFVHIKWRLQLSPYKGANHFKGLHEALSWAGLSIPLIPWNGLSRRTAKPTKWHVRQVKTQINLGVHPVWSEKPWVCGYPLNAQRRLWSEWADAQAGLRLRRVHVSFVCFVLLRLSCFASLLPKIKIIIFYVPCTPKLSLCPCSPSFQTSVPLFPWNKCLCSLKTLPGPIILQWPAW